MLDRRGFLASATAAAGLAGCDLRGGIHWDLSLPWGPNEFHVHDARRFAAAVSDFTNGLLTIHVHPGAVLGIKGPDTLRAIEEGIVDMAEAASFQQVGSEPLLGLESLPYLVDDIDELDVLYQIIRPAVETAYARHNAKIIYIVPWPNQNFFFKQPIESLADFEGLTMRTYDKLSTDLTVNLGMTPVQMPSPDVVPALAAGGLDAAMTSTTTAAAQKFWEFLTHTLRSNHTWSSNILAVNLDSWMALPAATRDGIEAIARDLEPQFWDIARRDDAAQLVVLEENGMITQVPSPDLMAAMRAAAQPIWVDFRAQVAEAGPLIDAFLAATGKDVSG